MEPMPGGVMADITKNPPPEPGAPTRMSMSSPRPNQPVFSPRILPPGASADANFTTEDLLASTPVEYLLSTKPLDHEKHAFLVERLRSADLDSTSVELSWEHRGDSFSLWVVFYDRLGSLGAITSSLGSLGIDILMASTFSTTDGIAVDFFAVDRMDEELAATLRTLLPNALGGQLPSDQNIRRPARKSDRKPKRRLWVSLQSAARVIPVPILPLRRSKSKSKAVLPAAFRHDYVVHVPGLLPAEVHVSLSTASQHTLSWEDDLHYDLYVGGALEGARVLPAAQVNLYLFPRISVFNKDGEVSRDTIKPDGAQLEALYRLIVALAADKDCPFFREPDEVGAMPVHAIAVANTPQAIELTERVVFACPFLLTQVHTKHRLGFPLFTGEGTLHVLVVNQQEKLLCRCIELAMRRDGPFDLSDEQARAAFTSLASGVFFNDMPMRFYGGSPLAYAASFELREAVRTMLDTGLVSLNDRSITCPLSGFHPIHAVVASGSTAMYEFLSSELPREMQADSSNLTGVGQLSSLNLQGLAPLALATKLGDHAMVKHILRKQCVIVWVWGPVTAYSMDLTNIDSAGEGGTDMMELVARLDAKKSTRELLLDKFLDGFLHKLYLQKWRLFGRWLHYPRLCVDLTVLGMHVVFAFLRKLNPYDARTTSVLRWLFGCMGSLMLVNALFEIHVNYLYWKRISETFNAGLHGKHSRLGRSQVLGQLPSLTDLEDVEGRILARALRLRTLVPNLLNFMMSHQTHWFCLSYMLTFIGCTLACSYVEDDPNAIFFDDNATDGSTAGSASTDVAALRRLLRTGNRGQTVTTRTVQIPVGYSLLGEALGDARDLTAIMWLCISMAILTGAPHIAGGLFLPYERLNILMITVGKILRQDLLVFMVIFSFFVIEFGLSLFMLYPRSGTIFMSQVDAFNLWESALKSILELALTGSPTEIDLTADWSELSVAQMVNFGLFLILYIFYAVLALILLLNLFVAMLSATYVEVNRESTLQSRGAFAQLIMRHELVSSAWGLTSRVGEDKGGGKFTYDFRSCAHLDIEKEDPFAAKKAMEPLAVLEKKFDDLAKLIHQGIHARSHGEDEKLHVEKNGAQPLRTSSNMLGAALALKKTLRRPDPTGLEGKPAPLLAPGLPQVRKRNAFLVGKFVGNSPRS